MSGEKAGKRLNITFHNPNTAGEMAKHLIKIIAGDIAEFIANKKAPELALNDAGEGLTTRHKA